MDQLSRAMRRRLREAAVLRPGVPAEAGDGSLRAVSVTVEGVGDND